MNLLNNLLNNFKTNKVAIETLNSEVKITYKQLYTLTQQLNYKIKHLIPKKKEFKILIVMSNSTEWVISDLYCLLSGIIEISIPLSFSSTQTQSLVSSADLILVDSRGKKKLKSWINDGLILDKKTKTEEINISHLKNLKTLEIEPYKNDIIKVIHTSGTTNNPKGVMIKSSGLDTLLESLTNKLSQNINSRYFSIVP